MRRRVGRGTVRATTAISAAATITVVAAAGRWSDGYAENGASDAARAAIASPSTPAAAARERDVVARQGPAAGAAPCERRRSREPRAPRRRRARDQARPRSPRASTRTGTAVDRAGSAARRRAAGNHASGRGPSASRASRSAPSGTTRGGTDAAPRRDRRRSCTARRTGSARARAGRGRRRTRSPRA